MADIPTVDLDAILAANPLKHEVVAVLAVKGEQIRVVEEADAWLGFKATSNEDGKGLSEYLLSRIHPDDQAKFNTLLSGNVSQDALIPLVQAIMNAGSGHPTNGQSDSAPT